MDWLSHVAEAHPAAHALLLLGVTCCAGLSLGGLRVRGVSLGSAAVMFAGIGVSRLIGTPDPHVLEFARDFGLVLFVFMLGLQLGPGFLSAFRRDGLRFNVLSVSVVLLGTLGALAAWGAAGLTPAGAVGLLSGATTNTPSLAAAQDALRGSDPEAPARAASAYAVAYPAGVLGIITSLVLLKLIFRIDAPTEAAALDAAARAGVETLERRTVVIENPNLAGLRIEELPRISDFGVRISRRRPAGATDVEPVTGATVLHTGDALAIVGVARELDDFQRVVGRRAEEDLAEAPGDVAFRRVLVTRKHVLGRTLAELHLGRRFGVQVTRFIRHDIEMTPMPRTRLHFGDALRLVGDERSLDRAARELGNSARALNRTHLATIFLGLALGVMLGLAAVRVPGLPEPVRLGLAAGPMLVALLVGRAGNVGPLVWHVPATANIALRELGITLFLACVGLKAGPVFFDVALSVTGAWWLAAAFIVATVPLLVVGVVARTLLRMNYATLGGLLAGSTTDPPALAFACAACRSDAPTLAYASVYPVTMLLRVILAQALVLALI